jgi:hypothetical protein
LQQRFSKVAVFLPVRTLVFLSEEEHFLKETDINFPENVYKKRLSNVPRYNADRKEN